MNGFWSVLGLESTEDIAAIKRAYAEKTRLCHPEEDPEGFLRLREAYQAALACAEGRAEKAEHNLRMNSRAFEQENLPDGGAADWTLAQDFSGGARNPYEGGEAIRKFLDLYTGKQRKNPTAWMEYFVSGPFLDAGWNPDFTALLLEKVTELERTVPPGREFLQWLSIVYRYSQEDVRQVVRTDAPARREKEPGEADFDGMESILRIAAKGPLPKKPVGNEFAMVQSFQDYRHLLRLAEAGRWDQEALESFQAVLNRYAPAYIRERCEQRVTPDCERHPAGLRAFIHFFRREDLPEAVFRMAWQRLSLKSALMGRAGVLYGPLRALAVERVPGIEGEAPVNFLQLNRNLDAYLKRIRNNPEAEPAESAALFASPEMKRALPEPRFLEQQLLTNSPWRRKGVGESLIRLLLDYYREHAGLPRAEEVVSGLEEDLRILEAGRWSLEDNQADLGVSLTHRPFFRWWLNTAFYTARDPESGTPLLEYLEKYFPWQEDWSLRFAGGETRRTIPAAMAEINCWPMHLEYRVNGKPVYRPCLTWEEAWREEAFLLLLPLTAAPRDFFDSAAQGIFNRLGDTAAPEADRAQIARYLAGHVCRLPLGDGCVEPVPPEKALPMELSTEGGGRLYTAVWREDGGPVDIYRQTFSGRRLQERLEPDSDGMWPPKQTPSAGETPARAAAGSGLEAARQRLAELASPTYFDVSRLPELPWHIYFTPNGGEEECLTHIDLLRPEPKRDISELLEEWEEVPPEDIAEALAGLKREETPEDPSISPELLVTGEALSALLGRFALGELERLELEWHQGLLVLRRDGERYACLYFAKSLGRGEHCYALLSDPETYRTVDGDLVAYLPFGMGKLPEYSVFRSAGAMMRYMDLVLAQMGRGGLESGGKGGWLWSCDVHLHDAGHKLLMAQQKLGGVPQKRGRNYLLAKFVVSRFPAELETVDLKGEKTAGALRSGSYGRAVEALVRFMQDKLSRLRIAWAFKTPEGGTSLCHLVLLRDGGKYMMFWLQDGEQRALAYAAAAPERFMGRFLPAGLVHRDLKRVRNGVDLLLDDIDNTEPVLGQPGEFVPVPYEELRAALVSEQEA